MQSLEQVTASRTGEAQSQGPVNDIDFGEGRVQQPRTVSQEHEITASTGNVPATANSDHQDDVAPTRPKKQEYLYLSSNFVHQKLRAFNPPCPVEVQVEVDGVMEPTVYSGSLADSSAKGYYCLDAPPRELLVNKEIFGIRLKSDGRIILQIKDRAPPLATDEGRRRLTPRFIGITTSIRVDFLRMCFTALQEPRHAVSIKVEINGVRQPELFGGASISHNRQGSYYVLGLPFALVHGRAFVAWRHLDQDTLELAVQDPDPNMPVAPPGLGKRSTALGGALEPGSGNISSHARKGAATGIMVDSRISIPLAMLKRDLGAHLDTLLPEGLGPAFEIPIRVQYRVDGVLLPNVYENAVIKKSEHRGCCYLNGTQRIPVKSKVLCSLEMQPDETLVILDFRSGSVEDVNRRSSPAVGAVGSRSLAMPHNSTPSLQTAMPAAAPYNLGMGGASIQQVLHACSTGQLDPNVAADIAAAFQAVGDRAKEQAGSVALATLANMSVPRNKRNKRGSTPPPVTGWTVPQSQRSKSKGNQGSGQATKAKGGKKTARSRKRKPYDDDDDDETEEDYEEDQQQDDQEDVDEHDNRSEYKDGMAGFGGMAIRTRHPMPQHMGMSFGNGDDQPEMVYDAMMTGMPMGMPMLQMPGFIPSQAAFMGMGMASNPAMSPLHMMPAGTSSGMPNSARRRGRGAGNGLSAPSTSRAGQGGNSMLAWDVMRHSNPPISEELLAVAAAASTREEYEQERTNFANGVLGNDSMQQRQRRQASNANSHDHDTAPTNEDKKMQHTNHRDIGHSYEDDLDLARILPVVPRRKRTGPSGSNIPTPNTAAAAVAAVADSGLLPPDRQVQFGDQTPSCEFEQGLQIQLPFSGAQTPATPLPNLITPRDNPVEPYEMIPGTPQVKLEPVAKQGVFMQTMGTTADQQLHIHTTNTQTPDVAQPQQPIAEGTKGDTIPTQQQQQQQRQTVEDDVQQVVQGLTIGDDGLLNDELKWSTRRKRSMNGTGTDDVPTAARVSSPGVDGLPHVSHASQVPRSGEQSNQQPSKGIQGTAESTDHDVNVNDGKGPPDHALQGSTAATVAAAAADNHAKDGSVNRQHHTHDNASRRDTGTRQQETEAVSTSAGTAPSSRRAGHRAAEQKTKHSAPHHRSYPSMMPSKSKRHRKEDQETELSEKGASDNEDDYEDGHRERFHQNMIPSGMMMPNALGMIPNAVGLPMGMPLDPHAMMMMQVQAQQQFLLQQQFAAAASNQPGKSSRNHRNAGRNGVGPGSMHDGSGFTPYGPMGSPLFSPHTAGYGPGMMNPFAMAPVHAMAGGMHSGMNPHAGMQFPPQNNSRRTPRHRDEMEDNSDENEDEQAGGDGHPGSAQYPGSQWNHVTNKRPRTRA